MYSTNTHCPRTNNKLEGWHNKLKRMARKSAVNIYEIVKICIIVALDEQFCIIVALDEKLCIIVVK